MCKPLKKVSRIERCSPKTDIWPINASDLFEFLKSPWGAPTNKDLSSMKHASTVGRCLLVSWLVFPLTCAGEDFATTWPLSVKPWRYISFWTQSRMRGEGIISPSYYQSCIKAPSSGIPQQSTAQFPQLFYSDSCRRCSSWTGLVWWLSSSVSEE